MRILSMSNKEYEKVYDRIDGFVLKATPDLRIKCGELFTNPFIGINVHDKFIRLNSYKYIEP